MPFRSGENWEVDIDREKNRLYLELDGYLESETTQAAADATIEAAKQLDPGFGVVNDLSGFQPSDEAAMKHVKRGKRGLVKHGAEAAVRVVSESTTGQMQFDQVGQEEERYKLAKADSQAKAETLLDKV